MNLTPSFTERATEREADPLREALMRYGVLSQVNAVLHANGYALEHVVGPSRWKGVGRARQWVAHVARELSSPRLSWSEMSTLFRRGDHTTMLHAARKGSQLVPAYAPLPVPFFEARLAKSKTPMATGLPEGPPEASTLTARFLAELSAHHLAAGRFEIGDEIFRAAVIVGTKTEEQERARWMRKQK